jgi:hypothetical protein
MLVRIHLETFILHAFTGVGKGFKVRLESTLLLQLPSSGYRDNISNVNMSNVSTFSNSSGALASFPLFTHLYSHFSRTTASSQALSLWPLTRDFQCVSLQIGQLATLLCSRHMC